MYALKFWDAKRRRSEGGRHGGGAGALLLLLLDELDPLVRASSKQNTTNIISKDEEGVVS